MVQFKIVSANLKESSFSLDVKKEEAVSNRYAEAGNGCVVLLPTAMPLRIYAEQTNRPFTFSSEVRELAFERGVNFLILEACFLNGMRGFSRGLLP